MPLWTFPQHTRRSLRDCSLFAAFLAAATTGTGLLVLYLPVAAAELQGPAYLQSRRMPSRGPEQPGPRWLGSSSSSRPGPIGAAECNHVAGTPGDDIDLRGTEGPDCIDGGAGNDTIDGLGGDDIIRGGAGDDIIRGHGGRDTLDGGDGDDVLYGARVPNEVDDGNDLDGGPGTDELYGAKDADDLFGGLGDDVVTGYDGDDEIFGGVAVRRDEINPERVMGADGADQLDGGLGDDQIFGDHQMRRAGLEPGFSGFSRPVAGDDFVGGGGRDTMSGGPGNDLLSGMEGDDTIDAGAGDDRLIGGDDQDLLDGNADYDIGYIGGADKKVENIEVRCLDTSDTSAGGAESFPTNTSDTDAFKCRVARPGDRNFP